MTKRIRRTYLILPPQSYDAREGWTQTPYLIDRLEARTDPIGMGLRRKMGSDVALVDPRCYPDMVRREQK